MKKEIVLYEAFAGIGAQWKALKNLSEKLNIKVTNIGSCEWYIDAIISYISIHYGVLNSEINFSKQEMVNKLKIYLSVQIVKNLLKIIILLIWKKTN